VQKLTLESLSAYIILVCCKKQSRTPWRWCRQMPKCVRVKKLLAYKKACNNCWLIKSDVKHDAWFTKNQYQLVTLYYLFVGYFSDMFRPDLISKTHHSSDFITCNIREKTESDVWTQYIKYYNFITLYSTVYCTYCNLLYFNCNLLQHWF